ncbi:MAG TPA: hypothetical protein VHE83_00600, partial [Mycobacteriales bacterium]|nr:hypothetical protein [Mycobacteriales bacterium]
MDVDRRAAPTLSLRPAGRPIVVIGDSCCSAPPVPVAVEHDGCCPSTAERTDRRWLAAARLARALAWLSLAWMTLEGVLGLVAGLHDASIALVGWALGSAIEGLASVVVIWRFTGNRTLSEDAERSARRIVAGSFFLLAPSVAAEASHDLAAGHQAHPGPVGIVLTASSVVL